MIHICRLIGGPRLPRVHFSYSSLAEYIFMCFTVAITFLGLRALCRNMVLLCIARHCALLPESLTPSCHVSVLTQQGAKLLMMLQVKVKAATTVYRPLNLNLSLCVGEKLIFALKQNGR